MVQRRPTRVLERLPPWIADNPLLPIVVVALAVAALSAAAFFNVQHNLRCSSWVQRKPVACGSAPDRVVIDEVPD